MFLILMEVMIMAIKKDGVGNDRLTFRAQAFQPGGCDCDTPGYEDEVGNDNVVDLSCSDSVKVLRTLPMELTDEERDMVKGYLKIADITRAYIAANGHLFIVMNDGTERDVGDARGFPGDTPYIGGNGNWFIAGKDTGVLATGIAVMPRIGEDGNWYLGEHDTGVKARGENGITPHIGANGNWLIGEYDTGVHAQGDPGITPHIGENGKWFIGEHDTGVLARNEDVSFYADDLLTSGILGEGAMSLEILAPEGSNVIRYRIDSAVVYVKGVRRARGAFSVNRQAVGHERLIANVLRYNEAKGSFSWTLGEVVRDGEVFVNVDNGEIYPTRSDGYYDLVPYLVHIPAGATSITIEQVEDLRADERYCGYVRSRFAPTKVSELENDSGYVTGDQIENVITTEPQELTDKEKAQARANIGAAAAGEGGSIDKITSDMVVGALGYTPADTDAVPTKVSELENDEGFITRLVSDLANYYDKSEVNSRLSQIPRFSIRVVSVLTTTNISETTVYLVKSGSGPDLYTEYIHVGGIWEILGSQRVDLTGYATEEYVIAYVTADRIKQVLGYTPANASDLDKVRERAEVKPDLAQNDENADDYVKGRTHWREKVARVIVPAREKGKHYIPVTDGIKDLAAGKTYTVLAGGTEYSCTAYKGAVSELLYLGDSRLYDGTGNLNTSAHPENVPFLLEVFVSSMVGDDSTETDLTVWHSMSDERTTVSVIEPGVYDDGYRHIDDGYLPDSAARTDSAVMHDRTQNLDEGHKSLARKNIGALGEDDLPTAIDSALEQAKESGEFDGKDGYTPQKGVDYFDGEDGYTPQKGVDYFDGKDGALDATLTAQLYTDGVVVSEYPDALSVMFDNWNASTETASVIIKYGSFFVNGVGKTVEATVKDIQLPSSKDNRVALGYRLNLTTGKIEEKVWTDYTIVSTSADGLPLMLMVGSEPVPSRFNNNNYDIVIALIEKPKGSTSFAPNMITDTRGVKRFCGFVESRLSGGIGEDELSAAVEGALEQAKESGEFKGDPGEPGKDGFFYGVCSTDAATVAKTVEIEGFELSVGAVVVIKFENANSATNPTLNVSGTGAKPMYRYGTTVVSTGTTTTGWYAGAVQMFVYDGDGWIRDYWNNSTYSNASLGNGYTTCSTAASTKAKTASLSNYSLTTGGRVSVKFTNDVPAGATLNIATKGAKAIYYNGAAITDGIIKAGDTATFVYSTTYHLVSINRDTYTKEEVEEAINAAVGSVGGGAGIDVTAEVGQTIVVKEVDANGKPTKWEAAEYQEKICGQGDVYLIKDAVIDAVIDEEVGFGIANTYCDSKLEAGVKYKVVFNGDEYESIAFDVGDGTMIAGNLAVLGGDDTGEPYVLLNELNDVYMRMLVLTGDTQITLSVSFEGKTKIDKIYLPRDVVYGNQFNPSVFDMGAYLYATCGVTLMQVPLTTELTIGRLNALPLDDEWEDTAIPKNVYDVIRENIRNRLLFLCSDYEEITTGQLLDEFQEGLIKFETKDFSFPDGKIMITKRSYFFQWNTEKDCMQWCGRMYIIM